MNNSISAVAFHRVELKVSLEIPCIEARDWQPITKASLLTIQKQSSVPYTDSHCAVNNKANRALMGDINLICYTDSLPINHSLFARVLGHCETFVSGIKKLKQKRRLSHQRSYLLANLRSWGS